MFERPDARVIFGGGLAASALTGCAEDRRQLMPFTLSRVTDIEAHAAEPVEITMFTVGESSRTASERAHRINAVSARPMMDLFAKKLSYVDWVDAGFREQLKQDLFRCLTHRAHAGQAESIKEPVLTFPLEAALKLSTMRPDTLNSSQHNHLDDVMVDIRAMQLFVLRRMDEQLRALQVRPFAQPAAHAPARVL